MAKFRYVVLSFAAALLLSGCKLAILNPKGVIATSERDLLVFATLLMLVVVIPVIIMSFVIAWRYRASNAQATYSPEWSHNTLLEAIWWTIPCVIIAILAVVTWVTTHALDPYKPLASKKKPLIIEAIALNWKWLFIYPQQNLASINFVQIPINVPIRFMITADAPMNSLEIPQLAGQIYAMTGMQTKLNLMTSHPGVYDGLSTNFSGDGFSEMRFKVQAGTQKQFAAWIETVKKTSSTLTMATYGRLTHPSIGNHIQYFSTVQQGLFDMAIMKYMGPCMHGMGVAHAHLAEKN